ncbi:hypothetical protein RRG08_059968 [Elysia crispata]|uniref:Uncharacterized protein n=1 Tax=Elysia crispata TaxID=231223 RepID=A0AAE1AHL1_9GAST|nr:hypothetical protein RRG08_059968 [Elysia crispata]KAK3788015.1 hypothetical protein RRG08_059968 [Elysia crispata]
MASRLNIWATFIAVISYFVVAGKICTDITHCVEGQKCNRDNCIPCDPGTFQDERSHQQEECKPWTKKPPGSYWEIKSKGSNTIDQIWGCRDGYEKAIETQTNKPEEKEPFQNFSQMRALQMLALHLTENLCCEDMKILLLRLPTSDSFNAYVSMSYKRHTSQETYIETFIEWRKKNPCVNLIEITNTLVNNGQTEITEAEQYKKLIRELEEKEMVVTTEENDNQL